MMFERFTQDARRVVLDAQATARRLGHHYIGTEHLLATLASAETSTGAVLRDLGLTRASIEAVIRRLVGAPHWLDRDALAAVGIDLDQVLDHAEAAFGPDAFARRTQTRRHRWGRRRSRCESPSGHIPFTPRAKKCLELSLREALALKHRHIGDEHVALGLLRVDDGLAVQILRELHVSPAELRERIIRMQQLAG